MSNNKDVRVKISDNYSYVESEVIRVVVGTIPDQREFSVHQGLICPRSRFFEKAMKEWWREAKDKLVELPEDDPTTFALYMKLIYTGVLPIQTPKHRDAAPQVAAEYTALCKLYVLVDKLFDTKAQQVALDVIRARSEEEVNGNRYYPDLECVEIIYNGTPERSPARSMLVDFYNDHGDEKFLNEAADSIPKDFLYDLSLRMLAARPRKKDVDAQIKAKNKEIKAEKDRKNLHYQNSYRWGDSTWP